MFRSFVLSLFYYVSIHLWRFLTHASVIHSDSSPDSSSFPSSRISTDLWESSKSSLDSLYLGPNLLPAIMFQDSWYYLRTFARSDLRAFSDSARSTGAWIKTNEWMFKQVFRNLPLLFCTQFLYECEIWKQKEMMPFNLSRLRVPERKMDFLWDMRGFSLQMKRLSLHVWSRMTS